MTKNEATPRVAIVGLCDRAARIDGPHPAFTHTNIQGLSSTRVSHIFPFNMRGLTLVVCLHNPKVGESYTMEFRHSDGAKAFDYTMSLAQVQVFDHDRKRYADLEFNSPETGWHLTTAQVTNDVLVMRPDTLRAFLVSPDGDQFLGSFNLLHAPLPPYSKDQIAALRSHPLTRRIIRVMFSCTECNSKMRTYTALERNKPLDDEGWIWFAELGDKFHCACGKLCFSLEYLRTGLHGLLNRSLSPDDQSNGEFVRLYETTKLENDCKQFKDLLDQNAAEEELQNFLEEHPIFFAKFSASRLLPKPRILTKHVADFAILNQRRELLLIEIEKPGTRLLTREGRITAELQHAVTQVTDWIQVVSDHKAAVLDGLGMELKEVAVVRGVVIAGRVPADDEGARALRRAFSGAVDFYTFDDLLWDTTEIIRQVANV